MSLAVATRLGPYEILGPAGAGGMGEVYKGRDSRLDRTVAIKILSGELAVDQQFRDRFDREARTISALSHPNICTLYDVGEVATPATESAPGSTLRYLVLEFLEGQTLAARLDNRARLRQHDVTRFQIAMNDAVTVSRLEGVDDVEADAEGVRQGQRSSRAGAKCRSPVTVGGRRDGAATARRYSCSDLTAG